MTARERMRLEKQKKADESAAELRHMAQENYAANRYKDSERERYILYRCAPILRVITNYNFIFITNNLI